MKDAVPATTGAGSGRARWSIVGRLLTHPLLLLLVGGVISGLAATVVTQRWQDHQRALDTRRAFVRDMTRSAITDLFALDRFAGALAGYPRYNAAELKRRWAVTDAADKQWVVQFFTIKARLQAYYPRSPATAAWTRVLDSLERVWADEQGWYQDFDQRPKPKPIPYRDYQSVKDRQPVIVELARRAAQLVLR